MKKAVNAILEMIIDVFLFNDNGMVFNPASLSDVISLISKGMVMAKIKKKRSISIVMINDLLKVRSDWTAGKRVVEADQISAIKNIFK